MSSYFNTCNQVYLTHMSPLNENSFSIIVFCNMEKAVLFFSSDVEKAERNSGNLTGRQEAHKKHLALKCLACSLAVNTSINV